MDEDLTGEDTPELFFNWGEEHTQAEYLVRNSGIPYRLYPYSDVKRPTLLVGLVEYEGLEEIKKFIEEYKRRREENKNKVNK
jgi:ABC-type Fe3+-hydroxamate transport system substrate-binding protein